MCSRCAGALVQCVCGDVMFRSAKFFTTLDERTQVLSILATIVCSCYAQQGLQLTGRPV